MSTTVSVHEAFTNLEAKLADSRTAAAISVRLLKLVSEVVDHWKQDDSLEDAAALTDAELLSKFAVSGAIARSLDTRQKRLLARRAEARIQFLADLKDVGGLFKASQAAKILGVSRQTINNHIGLEKLIAIKEGNDYLIPGFQFDENGKLEGLEDVLLLLKGASAEAKCSFFLSPIALDGGAQALPYEILKNGASNSDLFQIKREANFFLKPR